MPWAVMEGYPCNYIHGGRGGIPQFPTMELREGDLGCSQRLILRPFGTLNRPISSLDPYSFGICEDDGYLFIGDFCC